MHLTVLGSGSGGNSNANATANHNNNNAAANANANANAAVNAAASGEAVPWLRIHKLGDYAYFPHHRHVNRGVGCVECHGRIDQMVTVKQVQPLSMGWCLECHRDPASHLRPVDKITTMDWAPPSGETAESFGQKIVSEKQIAPPTDCSRCHR